MCKFIIHVCVYVQNTNAKTNIKIRQEDQGNQYVIKTFSPVTYLIFVKIKNIIRPTLMSNSSFFTVDVSL